MSSGSSLSHYLSHLSQNKPSAEWSERSFLDVFPHGLVVVLGNESADLDSIVSAIVYAWFLFVSSFSSSSSCSSSSPPPLPVIVPLVQIPRGELALRSEVVWLFSTHLQIDVSSVWFLEELGFLSQLLSSSSSSSSPSLSSSSPSLNLVLVDHNRLSKGMVSIFGEGSVTEILDHHVDEKLYQETVKEDRRRITVVGSCATLVGEKIIQHLSTSAEKADLQAWTGEIQQAQDWKTMLLSAILIDTSNFAPETERATPTDVRVAKSLQGTEETDLLPLYQSLRTYKYDITHLSTADLLRRDYKQWTMAGGVEVGISSVGMDMLQLANRGDLLAEISLFFQAQKLQFFALMTNFLDDAQVFQRQLLLHGQDPLLSQAASYLTLHTDFELQSLPASAHFPDSITKAFLQKNIKASRKQIQPALDQFFQNRAAL
jgi:exopolyphosphatase